MARRGEVEEPLSKLLLDLVVDLELNSMRD